MQAGGPRSMKSDASAMVPLSSVRVRSCFVVHVRSCDESRGGTEATSPRGGGRGALARRPADHQGRPGEGHGRRGALWWRFPGWCHNLGRKEPPEESGMSLTICCKLPLSNLCAWSGHLLDLVGRETGGQGRGVGWRRTVGRGVRWRRAVAARGGARRGAAAKGGAAELDHPCGAEQDHPAGVKRRRAPACQSTYLSEH